MNEIYSQYKQPVCWKHRVLFASTKSVPGVAVLATWTVPVCAVVVAQKTIIIHTPHAARAKLLYLTYIVLMCRSVISNTWVNRLEMDFQRWSMGVLFSCFVHSGVQYLGTLACTLNYTTSLACSVQSNTAETRSWKYNGWEYVETTASMHGSEQLMTAHERYTSQSVHFQFQQTKPPCIPHISTQSARSVSTNQTTLHAT